MKLNEVKKVKVFSFKVVRTGEKWGLRDSFWNWLFCCKSLFCIYRAAARGRRVGGAKEKIQGGKKYLSRGVGYDVIQGILEYVYKVYIRRSNIHKNRDLKV